MSARSKTDPSLGWNRIAVPHRRPSSGEAARSARFSRARKRGLDGWGTRDVKDLGGGFFWFARGDPAGGRLEWQQRCREGGRLTRCRGAVRAAEAIEAKRAAVGRVVAPFWAGSQKSQRRARQQREQQKRDQTRAVTLHGGPYTTASWFSARSVTSADAAMRTPSPYSASSCTLSSEAAIIDAVSLLTRGGRKNLPRQAAVHKEFAWGGPQANVFSLETVRGREEEVARGCSRGSCGRRRLASPRLLRSRDTPRAASGSRCGTRGRTASAAPPRGGS
jgi:hypothetical protein